jgi:DNA-binding response OmpR family regulator
MARIPRHEAPTVTQKQIVILAEDPRLGRLLLWEANAAGFDGIVTTEPEQLEQHYRNAPPDLTLMEVDGPLERVRRLLEFVGAYQRGRLVVLSDVSGAPFGELMQLADALGVSIHGTLHKPMELQALRRVLRDQEQRTSPLQVSPKARPRSAS